MYLLTWADGYAHPGRTARIVRVYGRAEAAGTEPENPP